MYAVLCWVDLAPLLAALQVLAVVVEKEISFKVQAGAALLGILTLAEKGGHPAPTAR
jgi:hypothetical protein